MLQRTRGADAEMPVADGDDLGDVVLHAIDDAVVSEKDLTDVGTSEFPDDTAG